MTRCRLQEILGRPGVKLERVVFAIVLGSGLYVTVTLATDEPDWFFMHKEILSSLDLLEKLSTGNAIQILREF